MDEIITTLSEYFLCRFSTVGEVTYMHFNDGDIYALNLVKCNRLEMQNVTLEENKEE